jgi:uncharacterized protein
VPFAILHHKKLRTFSALQIFFAQPCNCHFVTSAIMIGMKQAKIRRYIGVSGTAEMSAKTMFGRIYTGILKRTPIGHAVRDHDAALRVLQQSKLDWTLVGCNYLKTGPKRGHYKVSLEFPGGFKIIHPPDVANFILRELVDDNFINRVVGIWY